jgi:CRP-like cAMP-binding protein
MLTATHQTRKLVCPPGETILRQGDPVDGFYMIDAGSVEIVGIPERGAEVTLARLEPGGHFGEVELLHDVPAIASVRAAGDRPVEIAVLEKEAFLAHLGDSAASRKTFEEIVAGRMAENASMRSG